ncbi:hypothetical protein ACEPAH_7099 [Sanghuangporus vaninii]
MPTRTDAQRLELKDHFRRAANDYNRQSQFRRGAFVRMLELAKEPDLDSFCKKLIVERVKDFFIDFPEFQDEAINIVYDMCEDQDQEVRIAGYGAITSVSKVDKSWLMRNADVLVQLLQSDDPREVTVVKRALQQHVDLDPRGTLQVLCEQCVLNPADLGDDEERLLRSRLRSLVLQFLADKYRVCIIRVVKNQEVESILLKGMLEAIPQASPSEVHMIITDILLNLPSLSRGPSQSGSVVLQTLLDAVKLTLEAEQTDINKLCHLLEEAVRVVTPLSLAARSTSSSFPPLRTQSMHSMPAADGLQVLKFFADYSLLDRVPCGAALKVAECICATCDSTSNPENKNSASVQFLGLAPGLLTMLRRCLPTQRIEVTSRSCHAVLRAIEEQVNVTKEDFSPPPSLAAALDALIHEIGSMTSDTYTKITQTADANTVGSTEARAHQLPDDAKQAMEISRSLLKAVGNRGHRVRGQDRQTQTSNGQQGPPHGLESSNFASRILASALPGSRVPSRTRSGLATSSLLNAQALVADEETSEDAYVDASSQPKKKLKSENRTSFRADSGGSSSLLSRLGAEASTPVKSHSMQSSVSGCVADSSEAYIHANGGGDLLSRITDSAALPIRKGPPRFITNTNSRGQKPPASAVVGHHGPLRKDISHLSTYGEAQTTLGEKEELRHRARRSSLNEPMGISILGASSQGEDEIKIRGAAERRKGSDNGARALNGGGLSLLARLDTAGGGAPADHSDGRKRKRAKS